MNVQCPQSNNANKANTDWLFHSLATHPARNATVVPLSFFLIDIFCVGLPAADANLAIGPANSANFPRVGR